MMTFVEVVRKSSFTLAAHSLGISRALVSRHVTDLEMNLGVRLLNRTTRSISLTEAGQRHFDFSSRILSEMFEEEESISNRNEEAEGRLGVIVPKWIGNLDIADVVASFCVEYPKIRMELVLGGMSQKSYDFIERGFDVALLTRAVPDSLVKVKKVATLHYVVVGAPALIAQHGAEMSLRDLMTVPCLVQSADPTWRFQSVEGEPINVKVNSVFASNSYLVLRRAALKGLGLALLPRQVVLSDLESGQLVEVLDDARIPERPLYAAYAPGGAPPRKVRCFIDYLTHWFRRHPVA